MIDVERRYAREQAARLEAERIAEDALRRAYDANKALQTLNAELDNKVLDRTARLEHFASMVGHDLQQPLSAARLRLATLARTSKEAAVQKTCQDVDRVLAEMGRFIDDLLEFSRTGTLPTPQAVDVGMVLDGLMPMFEGRLDGGRIAWEALPQVMADETRVRHVFQNLLDNAVKYRSREPPRVTISGRRDGGTVVFRVEDNGKGIAADAIDRIFEVFERGDGEAAHGHGIGLATVRRLVEARGGAIHAEALPHGTAFVIRWPAA